VVLRLSPQAPTLSHLKNRSGGSNGCAQRHCKLRQQVRCRLIRDSGNLSHGIWTTQPPVRIEAGTTVGWESGKNGVTIDPGDGSGPQFIDLPSMGATVNKPDIFVQLDWMADSTHSHALSAAAIQTVVTAFAKSPYKSRTGSVGINLHVDAGPTSIMNFATNQTWGALSRARQLTEVTNLGAGGLNNYSWTAFDAIKNAVGGFKSTGRAAIFRYAISAHLISNLTNSGIARTTPGSDFIVSLAAFSLTPTTLQQALTFMHELGHNLGLKHGGGDGVNNKPNYISIMNYSFQEWTDARRRGQYRRLFERCLERAERDEPG
jgi:hypothetical protein